MTTAMIDDAENPGAYEAEELVRIIRKGAEIAIENGTPVDPKALLDLIDRNGVYA